MRESIMSGSSLVDAEEARRTGGGNNVHHSTLPKKWTGPLNRVSSIRRSFTIPRSIIPKKSTGEGPVSENNSNFIKNIFLTLLRNKNPNHQNSEAKTNNHKIDLVPAAVGLKNQGNTCYMNSILQCLSHTDALAKFLVTDTYKTHLRKKYFTKNGKGEVTEEFASILKSAWFRLSALEEAATKFKSAVEKGAPQWRGSEEHDAQEFLLWILDRLHEDLNQATSIKYKPTKKRLGVRSDEEIAAEALEQWTRSNHSIIQEIFGAQFRSSLTCPGCGRESATFEPFLCVSLPIPEAKEEVPIYVHLLYLAQQPRLVKMGLSLPGNGDVKDLKDALSVDSGINQMLLLEIDGEGFHRTFTDSQPLSVTARNEAIYAVETPTNGPADESHGATLLLVWANILVGDGTKVRFASPYISQFNRETSYEDLQKLLLKEMAPILRPGVLCNEQKKGVFGIRIVDGSKEGTLVDPLVTHPLYTEAVDEALSLCDADVVPHVKILLEWIPTVKEELIGDELETVEEHSSLRETRERHASTTEGSVGLEECFDLYTGAEELSPEDSWHCPHCNKKEEGTLKSIGLWSAPQILVLHLKRFRQGSKTRGTVSKISSLVDFPLESFDLGRHVSRRNRGPDSIPSLNQTKVINNCFGNWKQRASFKKSFPIRSNGFHDDDDLEYDLFAVCNHHGKDLQGGHYTAYCKNPLEKQWWAFDDTRVRQLTSPDEVKSSSAYILFYQKRTKSEQQDGQWIRSLLHKRRHNLTNHNKSNGSTTIQTTTTNNVKDDAESLPPPPTVLQSTTEPPPPQPIQS